VANFIRLLDLPEEIQEIVSRGTISMGHARALLGVRDERRQLAICKAIVKDDLSVRDTERLCSAGPTKVRPRGKTPAKSPHVREIEDRLRQHFGTKVEISDKNGRGKVVIEYYNLDDFQRIIDRINGLVTGPSRRED
jgi:ParB family chromosome partitioning protein